MCKSINKTLCLVLAILLIFGLMIGCNKEQQTPSSGDETTATPEPASQEPQQSDNELPTDNPSQLEWMSDTSPVKLSAFMDFTPNSWRGWGEDPVSKEITRRTGVTVEIETATTTDHQQLNTMIAANELPDFVIITADSPVRTTLWKQDFLLPLNELIDNYAKNTRNIIPTDMEKIVTEEDGNFYIFVGSYCDVERLANTKGARKSVGAFSIHTKLYESLGNPAMNTLEEYKNVLKMAKEQFPDMKFLSYDGASAAPQDGVRNMAQLINRIYGGTDTKAINPDGTVHLNFQDETYFQAIKYINSLYREGLFHPENFTTQQEEQFAQIGRNEEIFSYWGQGFQITRFDMSDEGPYKPNEPPQEPGIELKLKSNLTGIGGWPAVGITADTQNAKRAMYYLQFLMSDEGQMLTYHGIEGEHYTIEDGMPKNTPLKTEAWKDFPKMQSELGIINYVVSWLPSSWVDNLYYRWLDEDRLAYKMTSEIYSKYAVNERMNDLIKVPSDSPEKVIETQIMDLWKASLPLLYLAESDDQLNSAYEEFISSAKRLGLEQLELAYTENNKYWEETMK